MALTGSFTYKGISLPDSYVRIVNFVFIGKFECRAQVEVYIDEQHATTVPYNPIDVVFCNFVYDPNGTSLHNQAYLAALLMSEFSSFEAA